MSIVIVTGDGPEHKFVSNMIQEQHIVRAILQCERTPPRSWRKVLRKSQREFAGKVLRRLFLSAIGDDRRRARSLRRVLGARSECFLDASIVELVGPPKSGRLAQRVAELKPDVIVVYGTGIVPDDVLKQARVAALNMHTGLSPWYRGTACAFWPIHDGQPELVGATVHECTSAVDGGEVYFRERAMLYRGDDLHAVFGRAVATGAKGYVRVIGDALAGRLKGTPQNLTIGKEFRGTMQLIVHELKARRNLRRLSRNWPVPSGVDESDPRDAPVFAIGNDR